METLKLVSYKLLNLSEIIHIIYSPFLCVVTKLSLLSFCSSQVRWASTCFPVLISQSARRSAPRQPISGGLGPPPATLFAVKEFQPVDRTAIKNKAKANIIMHTTAGCASISRNPRTNKT